ncbi:hypothetical protein YPPY47_3447 [Yersinia pestis PY-47]|uniref:Uncharacterized protein n=1 Tax=Yersinia pestis PY-08 TaxID=992134 RepID=A0AB72ZI14_YERPE|nr:hypothetical protein YpK1973002_2807 [Yersinia pestis biovar Mediaevalis str. K1973002]EFA49101.1 hypothetical protein YPD27_3407 [Yersinia pestis KIM D27]EIQ86436.1 hypothetical protein YPPY01_3297 [Yersinia pestis PY-01]EIQ87249.1 hypothetical protein YPPY02_3336 [Yersinia pestis PY-02]EIQ87566.1 hypothetical protein YPPY03_3401 [Yersinia pestis PY-03]EIQ99655.1 hypothetical protein YPPY04_3350 [Yersinia pestis PY-04]EIR00783.1 hypothetical protein YPPY05_3329 [Yersinia pestis PY-05]EIR
MCGKAKFNMVKSPVEWHFAQQNASVQLYCELFAESALHTHSGCF